MADEAAMTTKDIGKLVVDGLRIPIERPDGEPSGFGEGGEAFDIVAFDGSDPSRMTLVWMTLVLDNGQRFAILVSVGRGFGMATRSMHPLFRRVVDRSLSRARRIP